MTSNQNRKNQAGAALLLAIFALALVSAIGLAMLFASDTETSISANYRDKQTAIYGALSGLQEARDRIQPRNGDLAAAGLVPTSLPVAGGKNVVLYIINPQNGEDVRPWDSGNKYFDTELCQEQALGLSGTPGVPCGPSDIPAGTDWFRVYDNSANETIWKLKNTSGTAVPLSYKWVRVTLKADNAAPLKIPDATKATGKQLCWDGLHQLPLPAGYKSDCTPPADGVAHIKVTNGGSGYAPSSIVNVTVAAPPGGGTRAEAAAKLETSTTGQIGSLTLTDNGKGYTTPPSVVIAGDGTGATGHALLGGNPIVSATLSSAGSPVPGCYDAATAQSLKVAFSGAENSGSGAAATVTVTGQRCVIGWGATGSCNGKKGKSVTVTGTGGSGTQFTGTISFDNSGIAVSGSAKVLTPGDYSSLPTGTDLPNGCDLKYSFTPGVQISKVTLTNGGDYYVDPVTATIAGATQLGNDPVISAHASGGTNAGKVTSLVLDKRGSGYTSATVTIAAPVGAGTQQATGTASVAQVTSVSGVTVTNPGSGYAVAPTVTIDPPGGSGVQATAVAELGNTGGYFGQVYLITSFAETPSGARAMAQMEVATTYDQFTFNLGGALTLAGPYPHYGSASGAKFVINGNDNNSCSEDKMAARPAIGVYDDPNHPTMDPNDPTKPKTALQTVLDSLAKPDNYIGAHAAPDIENVFNTLGDSATVAGLNTFVNNVKSRPTANTYWGDPGDTLNPGTADNPIIDVVNGDLTLAGNPQGYGILLVTGTLNLKGDFDWHGLVLVIGQGAAVLKGGGNMTITGSMFVANTAAPTETSPGPPSVDWSGGGNNSILYDHCWADNLLKQIPVSPTVSPNALRVLSTRMLEY